MSAIVVILAIAVVVLVVGYLLAKKVFVRGSMPETPEQDKPVAKSREEKHAPEVSHDPRAVGRQSERGYEQKL
jgi:hypothetical protein